MLVTSLGWNRDSDIGDLTLVTIKGSWWLNVYVVDIFWLLMFEANVKREWMMVAKMAQTVINI